MVSWKDLCLITLTRFWSAIAKLVTSEFNSKDNTCNHKFGLRSFLLFFQSHVIFTKETSLTKPYSDHYIFSSGNRDWGWLWRVAPWRSCCSWHGMASTFSDFLVRLSPSSSQVCMHMHASLSAHGCTCVFLAFSPLVYLFIFIASMCVLHNV